MHTLYTLGYSTWSIEQLATVQEELNALLIDIRYNPFSSRPEWRKEELRRRFRGNYIHASALGNLNYQGGPIELANPHKAVTPIRAHLAERPCILMCACADWQHCHRREASLFLAHALGATIEHLDPPIPHAPDGCLPALTLKAPWGWAVLHAGKDVENRSHRRFANLRGRIAIHQSQRVTRAEYLEACACIRRHSGLEAPHYDQAGHGCVIGTVEVTRFVSHSQSPWFVGPYGLVLRNPRPFAHPLPAKGQQGIWFWKPPIEQKEVL